jgi:hypothetical protein
MQRIVFIIAGQVALHPFQRAPISPRYARALTGEFVATAPPC